MRDEATSRSSPVPCCSVALRIARVEIWSSTIPPWYGTFQISPPGGTPAPLSHYVAIDGEGRTDARAQRDAHHAIDSARRSGSDFTDQIGGCVVEKTHPVGSPAEVLGKGPAQIESVR